MSSHTHPMLHDQTAKAIVEDVLRQLQGEHASDPPDRKNVQREVLKALDELRHRVATDSKWLDDLLASWQAVEVKQAGVPAKQASGSRRFDRRRVTVPVTVQIDGLEDLALSLRDVSSGGLAIISRQSFSVLITQIHLTLPTGATFTVEAEAVHCQLDQVDPEIQFLSGWRFTTRNAPAVIQALIAALTTPIDAPEP